MVLGGSRSGKSEFAENIAVSSGKKIIYIATAVVRDEEMAERVKLHRKRRPKDWLTVEEEKDVLGVLGRGGSEDVFLLDCATVWLTNLLFDKVLPEQDIVCDRNETEILEQVVRLADSVKSGLDLIVVSNEVGLGLVPEYPLGRFFRDLAGKTNQVLASKADSVYLVVAGIPMKIKS